MDIKTTYERKFETFEWKNKKIGIPIINNDGKDEESL